MPNASLMVIEHAERFGLAQLHQLRGRIGRGARESVCILLYQAPLSEAARARLKVIYENSDGFAIAQRGPASCAARASSSASARAALPLLRFADLARDEALARGRARGRRATLLAQDAARGATPCRALAGVARRTTLRA